MPKPVILLIASIFLAVIAACSAREPDRPTPVITPTVAGEETTIEETSSVSPSIEKTVVEVPIQVTTIPETGGEEQDESSDQAITEEDLGRVENEGNPLWGIEMHAITKDNGLELVKQGGTDWIRRNALLWSDVENQEGERNWDVLNRLEDEMVNATEAGMELILIVRSTPPWAQKEEGTYCGQIQDDKIDEFASFMHDVVERYSVPPYNVIYWEIGNEPDIDPSAVNSESVFGCWGDRTDKYYGGGYYAKVLKLVYPQVKAANPDAQLLVGGLLLDCDPFDPPQKPNDSGKFIDCTSSRFLEGILEGGGGDYFDGVSFHAYDYYYGKLGKYGNGNWHSGWNTTGPVLSSKTRFVRYVLDLNGFPSKYLINSEVALLCGTTGKESICRTEEFELTKAYYAAQVYAVALAEKLRANIWYSTTGWRSSGMMAKGWIPLPVFDAYQFSATELKDAVYVSDLRNNSEIMGYEFDRDGTRIWILWSLDGEEHLVTLPELPIEVYDVFGAPLPITRELNVTLEPVYIEFSP